MTYDPRSIEQKWQANWNDKEAYKVQIESEKPKYYVLDMFPYPSGSGLHVGHPLGYIASDIISRYKRMQGFNVLHPMGYDAFGLPAEQYAIQKGVHPAHSTQENILRYRKQLENIGLSFDWSREINTSAPTYYKWTQYIFTLLFDHYYDLKSNKATPITQLIQHFEINGAHNVPAFSPDVYDFSAEDWSNYSPKEKDDILMSFRLAYRRISYVNWCEALGTVLANDEVVNGVSERGGYPVVQKPMLQWSLRITAYAERLLDGLKSLDWSDALKLQQQNWIGKSIGASIDFNIHESTEKIEVFTTRPDTIFGCTFMVLAPEHKLVEVISSEAQKKAIQDYILQTKSKSERDRMSDKSVSGVFTGAYAIHPVTEEKLPIYISDYVLNDYGTGAIMAVPSNDERDHKFAEHFDIAIKEIMNLPEGASIEDKNGELKNSSFLNGLTVKKATSAIIAYLEKEQKGRKKVNYKLRDANFSRQRYWGEPFPILYRTEDGTTHTVEREQLPVELPPMDDIKSKDGKAPLSKNTAWVNQMDGYTRETDTMPGFAGSSWYFLRYMDPKNPDEMFSDEAVNYWRDVDLYVGGTEHAVGHLMYARFWNKFLYDIGKVPTDEPFRRLINQGMIQGRSLYIQINKGKDSRRLHVPIALANEADELTYEKFVQLTKEDNRFEDVDIDNEIAWENSNGERVVKLEAEIEKMSKSKYNVINPDDVIESYGADCFRLFEMFLGPIEDHKPWDTQSINGVAKFLHKLWHLFYDKDGNSILEAGAPTDQEFKILHTAIKKVGEDIDRMSFNTCISAMMIAVNDFRAEKCHKSEILKAFIKLLAPFAPHIAEELYQLFDEGSILDASFPNFDEKYLTEDAIEYPICINGKKRGTATFDAGLDRQEIEKMALATEIAQKWMEGKRPKKVIVVPNKMVNIVI